MEAESTTQWPEADRASSDEELLRRLRDGDQQAYVSLWKRHVDAALRVGHRILPTRAEDLVSESFLALYQQVTTTGKGPTSAFRAYLFTVMRNMAIQWSKESGRVDSVAEIEQIEQIDLNDGLLVLERDAEAAELFAAFQELPERWQRVLWLGEVEGVARPKIAAELGVKPNAISSLQRRARAGLQLQWLLQRVPQGLRDDPSHVAGLLPAFVLNRHAGMESLEITTHMSDCGVCADVHHELKPLAARIQKTTLIAAGFGALAVVLPAASPFTAPAAIAAALATGAASGLSISGGMTAGGIGALAIGGAIIVALLGSTPGTTMRERDGLAGSAQQVTTALDSESAAGIHDAPAHDDPPLVDAEVPLSEIQTGRHNTDTNIDVLDFSSEPDSDLPPLPPTPDPAPPESVPDPGTEETKLSSGMVTPTTQSEYFAPVLRGTTAPGTQVAVKPQGNENVFLAEMGDDGTWEFDFRPFDQTAGTYDYVVWAYTDTEQSPEEQGSYTLLPLVVRGFEGNPTLDISEAKDTGIVMTITGPAGGLVCLDSMMGQSAFISLDDTGRSTLRLRMHSNGFYAFYFRACVDGYRGAATETFVTVDDPNVGFEPWGPDPAGMTFDLSAP